MEKPIRYREKLAGLSAKGTAATQGVALPIRRIPILGGHHRLRLRGAL